MRRRGGDRPGLFDGAYLGHRYRSEFALTEVPAPIRRLVFPVIAGAGRLLGLHRRFGDAPEPLTSSGVAGDGTLTAPVRGESGKLAAGLTYDDSDPPLG